MTTHPSSEALGKAETILRRRSKLPREAPCLHPDCSNSCAYPTGVRGQRRLFCSRECANRFSAQRLSLIKDIQAIDDALSQIGPRTKNAEHLKEVRAQLSWLLARYGGAPHPDNQDRDRPAS